LGVLFALKNQPKQTSDVTYQTVNTAKGQRTTLKLSDGTIVKLNSASRLKIPSNYNKNKRLLYLKGEAFFKVKHNGAKPFRVYTKGIYTEDLGTRFNINAYSRDSTVEVVVASGKVEVGRAKVKTPKKQLVHLTAHEGVTLSKTSTTDVKAIPNLAAYIGWKTGKLVFEDTPFRSVIKRLERWYNITCIVKDKSLLNQKLTATFKNESLSGALKLISQAMNIRVKLTKRTVVFSDKK
jgi:ferric-dicitrate binding protein FerR (iron transport regulator)